MKDKVGISYSDYYLPEKFVGIKEYFLSKNKFVLPGGFEDIDTFCDNFVKQRHIKGIYINEEKSEVDIFIGLLEKFFRETKVDSKSIDIIIYTKGVPLHENVVSIPYYMQKKFDMENAAVFNVEQTCGAALMSMQIAESMIHSGKYNSALILSSSLIKDNDKRDVKLTLISDGAAMLYMEKNPKRYVIEDSISRTTGSYSYTIDSFTKRENYRELIKYLKNGADTINLLLEKNKLTMNDIQIISPQNTTYSGWEIYASLLHISMDKIYLENIPKGAHIGDVDSIRNITDIFYNKKVAKDKYFIAYGIGWGTSWNALLLSEVSEE